MEVTPLMAGIATAFVCFAASVPGIGWLMRTKRNRFIAGALALILSVALGVLVARLIGNDVKDNPPATDGGQI